MTPSIRVLFALGAVLAHATAGTVASQSSLKDRAAGLGAVALGPFDIELPTNNDGAVGVIELKNRLYVSSRGAGAQPPHVVHTLDAFGNLVNQWFQTPLTGQSSWGFRDGATDGVNLAYGYEGGILIMRPTDGQLVTTFNGQTIQNPIRTPALKVHRGVAFNPAGDNGKGSFWVGDFADPLYEIDLQGNILTTIQPPTSEQWSIYGLAWDSQQTPDPNDDTLWISSVPNEGQLRELDPTSGSYTGSSITRHQAGSYQGGLDGVEGTNGRFSLISLDQGAPDAATLYRVDRDLQNPGEKEALLLSSVGTGPLSVASPKFFGQPLIMSLGLDISADPTLINRPAFLIMNIGPNLPNAKIPGYPEVVAQLPATLIQPIQMGSPPIPYFIPPILPPGYQIRVQGVYGEPRIRGNQLVATNQVFLDQAEILVMAQGPNSYNSDRSRGFFSISNLGADRITSVVLDWTTSSNPLHVDQEFDTDQTGMAERFDGGSTASGPCAGTYRNGSHRAAGLVFDHLNTVIAPCTPGILPIGGDAVRANCGWIGTNPGNGPGDYRTLQFRFTSFGGAVTFEFDCDTDRGGTSGDEMRGLVVTIQMQSGRTLGPAELVEVPGQDRSILRF